MLHYRLRTILLGVALLTSGCTTTWMLEAGSPGAEEDGYNYVEDVTAAWRDNAGNVTLCVIGLPIGMSRERDGLRSYSIIYPGASPPEPLFALHEAIPIHIGGPGNVKGTCLPSMEDMTPVPVYTVYEQEFHDTPYRGLPGRAMATFLENYAPAPAPAIYTYLSTVDSGPYSGEHLTLYYVQETVTWDDVHVVEIFTAQR